MIVLIIEVKKGYLLWFSAGPPGVCVDDHGNERKVSYVC